MKNRNFKDLVEAMKSSKENTTYAAGEIFYENGKVVKEVLQHSDNISYEEAKEMQGMAKGLQEVVNELMSDNAPPDEIAKEVGKVVKKHKRFQ